MKMTVDLTEEEYECLLHLKSKDRAYYRVEDNSVCWADYNGGGEVCEVHQDEYSILINGVLGSLLDGRV